MHIGGYRPTDVWLREGPLSGGTAISTARPIRRRGTRDCRVRARVGGGWTMHNAVMWYVDMQSGRCVELWIVLNGPKYCIAQDGFREQGKREFGDDDARCG